MEGERRGFQPLRQNHEKHISCYCRQRSDDRTAFGGPVGRGPRVAGGCPGRRQNPACKIPGKKHRRFL